MTWKTHIEEITSKMSKSIGIISRTKHILPKYVLHTLYHTMIFPYMHYCLGINLSIEIRKYNCAAKRIIRIISLCNYREHTSSRFKELHTLKFTAPYYELEDSKSVQRLQSTTWYWISHQHSVNQKIALKFTAETTVWTRTTQLSANTTVHNSILKSQLHNQCGDYSTQYGIKIHSIIVCKSVWRLQSTTRYGNSQQHSVN